MNFKQVMTAAKAVLVGAGPSVIALAPQFGWEPGLVEQYISAGISPVGIVLLVLEKTETQIIADAASLPAPKAAAALANLPATDKVKVVNALPDVATVVLRDDVKDKDLHALAESSYFPNVVTETQNEIDAKLGSKVETSPPPSEGGYRTLRG